MQLLLRAARRQRRRPPGRCCRRPRCRRSLVTGLVGLPNVGKSSLFNALTGEVDAAQAANYPFCTIDPNQGIATLRDARLDALARACGSAKTIPAVVEFMDIAGLVEGASKGEGLGNKFLGNIRECDAIIHCVRCFDDEEVIHVETKVDPIRDVGIIDLELALSDLEQVERRKDRAARTARSGAAGAKEELAVLDKLLEALGDGRPARHVDLSDTELKLVRGLHLLTMKPTIYACNVDDASLGEGNAYSARVAAHAKADDAGAGCVLVSAKFESELLELDDAKEREEFLEMAGVANDDGYGLASLAQASYSALGLHTYYTAGPEEARAWTVRVGALAPEAAGRIHSDIQDGFIRADVVTAVQMVEAGTWGKLRDTGLIRSEGADYVVQEGDVMLFHHKS
jgi:ribosome-binding ATPase